METLYYTIDLNVETMDGELILANDYKTARLYNICTQDMSLVTVAEIDIPYESNTEIELQKWLDEFWGDKAEYNFKRL